VLIGAAGSGKSTFAARHFAAADILSSDAFRAIIAGDEADQRATRRAFGIIHREVVKRLAAGRLVVVDATNVERHARRALVRRAAAAGVPALAVLFALPVAAVLSRNASRAGRVVSHEIVERHLALAAGLDAETLVAEGFAAVHIVRAAEDEAAIEVVVEPADQA
jgi:protein phosphatase